MNENRSRSFSEFARQHEWRNVSDERRAEIEKREAASRRKAQREAARLQIGRNECE